MNESIEKPTLTLEQQKIISEFTLSLAVILDEFSKGGEDVGRRVLTITNQLIEKTNDPLVKVMLKNSGDLLDILSNENKGINDIQIKADQLSKK
ncbi:MAG: hypothetical protein WC241_02235 [Candidatus Paceibacterota bacterium]|jgi:hypothetical protein